MKKRNYKERQDQIDIRLAYLKKLIEEGGSGGGIQTIVAGTNITVDDTDPNNPIISSSGGTTPTLDEVLTAGHTSYSNSIVLGSIEDGMILDKDTMVFQSYSDFNFMKLDRNGIRLSTYSLEDTSRHITIARPLSPISTAYSVNLPPRAGVLALEPKEYTVATLPVAPTERFAIVTDATAPTYLGALTGGGTVTCPVFWNGTIWVSH